MSIDDYTIREKQNVRLRDYDPDDVHLIPDKAKAKEQAAAMQERLAELQELVYAGHQHKVLVLLQGMDASGKDGAIRHVMGGFNPQGVRVVAFGKPEKRELDHDYLWRVHQHVPGKGEVTVFNRSHYEDVLVVRVHELVPKSDWKKRYAQINDFERMLSETGTPHRQVLPAHQQGRTAQAAGGTDRRPHQALEVPARRSRGAQALERVPTRLRRGAVAMLHEMGPLVRHPRESEVVPQLPGQHRSHRRVEAPENELSAAGLVRRRRGVDNPQQAGFLRPTAGVVRAANAITVLQESDRTGARHSAVPRRNEAGIGSLGSSLAEIPKTRLRRSRTAR